MSQKIIIYGHGDKSKLGFPTAKDLQRYLSGGIFCDENGRYRYTQTKKADIIVLSRDGKAFGHLNTFHQEPPTSADLEEYPRTKQVYLVSKAVCYGKPVQVWKELGVRVTQFGKPITEQKFKKILQLAGRSKEYSVSEAI